MTHAPEPWRFEAECLVDARGNVIAGQASYNGAINPADHNWRRILACVNACRRTATKNLEELADPASHYVMRSCLKDFADE